jgi:hypothetical protein
VLVAARQVFAAGSYKAYTVTLVFKRWAHIVFPAIVFTLVHVRGCIQRNLHVVERRRGISRHAHAGGAQYADRNASSQPLKRVARFRSQRIFLPAYFLLKYITEKCKRFMCLFLRKYLSAPLGT